MANAVLGVIGGSGIYELPGLSNVREVTVRTPFGLPSGPLMVGELDGVKLVFLARHGKGHRLLPHEINYRANIYALKAEGVQWCVSASAVGSMREEIRPGDLLVVDQYIDRTQGRVSSFFGEGIAAHVAFGTPVSPLLSEILGDTAVRVAASSGRDLQVHRGGTYLAMNGPQFSTRAESELYRSWKVDVIGMTNMPEAKLAREAEISYASLALVTDYDCWHEEEEAVTVDAVVQIMKQNAALARAIIAKIPARLPDEHSCIAANALQHAIITQPDHMDPAAKEHLDLLIGSYL